MVKITQFRYYNQNNSNNYPFTTWQEYCSDTSFKSYRPIHQFGIQTLPGTKIYLNQSSNPIIIGATGMYEIDCDNTTAILNSFRIDQSSMTTIENLDNGYLIIDLVYGKESEDE